MSTMNWIIGGSLLCVTILFLLIHWWSRYYLSWINHVRNMAGLYLRMNLGVPCSGRRMREWICLDGAYISQAFFYACMARFEDEGWVAEFWHSIKIGDVAMQIRMYILSDEAQDMALHGKCIFGKPVV